MSEAWRVLKVVLLGCLAITIGVFGREILLAAGRPYVAHMIDFAGIYAAGWLAGRTLANAPEAPHG